MFKNLRCAAVTLAVVGMTLPQALFAADVAPAKSKVTDVQLTAGVLAGRVVTTTGQPVKTTVTIATPEGKAISTVQTNRDGVYRVADMEPGRYVVGTSKGRADVRLWSNAAPPATKDSLVLAEGPIIRGQMAPGGDALTLGLATTAVVLSTVAIVEANDVEQIVVSP